MQQYYTKIAREGSISFGSQIILVIINYLTAIFITRALGVENYGLYSLGVAIIQTATIFAGFGLGDALLRYIALFLGKNDAINAKGVWYTVTRFLCISYVLLTTIILITAPFISNHLFNKPELIPIIRILALSYPATIIISLVSIYFTAQKEFLIPVILQNVIQPGSKLIFALIILFLSLGAVTWSWAFSITAFLTALIAINFYQKKLIWQKKDVDPFSLKILFKFSLPLWGAQALPIIFNQLSILLLGYFRESAEVGIYKVYVFFTSIIVMGLGALASIFYPVFSEIVAKNDKKLMQNIYQRVTKWYYLITFSISILVLAFGNWLVPLLFGQDYSLSSPWLLYIIIGGHILNALTGPDGMTIKALGWTKFALFSSLISFSVNLIICYWLIPIHGMLGAAMASMIAIGLSHFYGLSIIKRRLRIMILSRESRRFLAIGILTIISILILRHWIISFSEILTLGIKSLLIIIFFLIIKLNIIDVDDQLIIVKFLKKIRLS